MVPQFPNVFPATQVLSSASVDLCRFLEHLPLNVSLFLLCCTSVASISAVMAASCSTALLSAHRDTIPNTLSSSFLPKTVNVSFFRGRAVELTRGRALSSTLVRRPLQVVAMAPPKPSGKAKKGEGSLCPATVGCLLCECNRDSRWCKFNSEKWFPSGHWPDVELRLHAVVEQLGRMWHVFYVKLHMGARMGEFEPFSGTSLLSLLVDLWRTRCASNKNLVDLADEFTQLWLGHVREWERS